MNLISGCSAVYGITKSISAPSFDRARAMLRQATPRPPLLWGGSSQPSMSIFIIFNFSTILMICEENMVKLKEEHYKGV